MSGKRKPNTPSPPLGNDEDDPKDHFAGRRISVSDFEGHDFLCEGVSSPGSSSTCSEPGYIRLPGFDFHAHKVKMSSPLGLTVLTETPGPTRASSVIEAFRCGSLTPEAVRLADVPSPPSERLLSLDPVKEKQILKGNRKKRSKEMKSSYEASIDGLKPPCKPKPRKDPLPMKLRALPKSFWIQPNKSNELPPSCSVLPPLILDRDTNGELEVRPPTPPEQKGKEGDHCIRVGETDLLFRLFDSIEVGERKKGESGRGRPKKSSCIIRRDQDPCLISTATESILPMLPDRTPSTSGASTPLGIRQSNQILEILNLKDSHRTLSLPSLNVESNYNRILSEIVLKL